MQDPKRKPWYHRVKEMATIWRTVSTKPPPIPAATTTTTLWRTIITTTVENHPRPQHDHSKLRKCNSLRVATSFTRACLCVPLSSYNEVFRSEISYRPAPQQQPRRSNSYPRSRSMNSSSSSSAAAVGSLQGQPRRSVEATPPGTMVVMTRRKGRGRREVFRGESLREDVMMRRFVAEEAAAMVVEERRRDQMEAVRRRSVARRKTVGPSRLSRMVLADDYEF